MQDYSSTNNNKEVRVHTHQIFSVQNYWLSFDLGMDVDASYFNTILICNLHRPFNISLEKI